MVARAVVKREDLAARLKRRATGGVTLSDVRKAATRAAVNDKQPKPFVRGTIEDRMDSENAGIVFLD